MPKKSNKQLRDAEVSVYLTKEDAKWFTDYARDFGFKSRSELCAAILERLRICGFSGIGGLKLCVQIQAHCQKVNPSAFRQGGLDFGAFRPFPPLPEVNLSSEDVSPTINEINQQLKAVGHI